MASILYQTETLRLSGVSTNLLISKCVLFLCQTCREFFQSLLKYWIPITLRHYKLNMCNFLCQALIPKKIKGNVLLESRRIGILAQFMENHLNLLKSLFAKAETKSLAFQTVTLPIKKSVCPSIVEVCLVIEYLEEASDCVSSKQLEALKKFCASSLALDAKYMNVVFKLGVSMLKTHRTELGAQILIALLHGNKSDFLTLYCLRDYCFSCR